MLHRLLMVQWLFATQHADEVDDIEIAAEESQDRREYPGGSSHPGNIFTGAVDEFLEHLDVVTFFAQFVDQIAKYRRPVGQFAP